MRSIDVGGGDTFVIVTTRCPCCGVEVDRATNVDPEFGGIGPRVGDFSICFHCGALLNYNDDLTLRTSTAEEQVKLFEQSPEAYSILQKIRWGILNEANQR